MTQSELNQLVAEQTGEDETTIQARGFMLHDDMSYEEREPFVIDWDAVQSERYVSLSAI